MISVEDSEFIEFSEINYFLDQMLLEIGSKPDDPNDAAQKYFQRISSGSHIIGLNYYYVTQCSYNRRSFVFCCLNAFNQLPNTTELTIVDVTYLVRAIVPDFPKYIFDDVGSILIEEFGTSILSNPEDVTSLLKPDAKFSILTLQMILYSLVLYEDWFKLVGECFRSMSVNTNVTDMNYSIFNTNSGQKLIQELASRGYDCGEKVICTKSNKKCLFSPQLSREIIDSVFKQICSAGYKGDVSFNQFRNEFCKLVIIRNDVFRMPTYYERK